MAVSALQVIWLVESHDIGLVTYYYYQKSGPANQQTSKQANEEIKICVPQESLSWAPDVASFQAEQLPRLWFWSGWTGCLRRWWYYHNLCREPHPSGTPVDESIKPQNFQMDSSVIKNILTLFPPSVLPVMSSLLMNSWNSFGSPGTSQRWMGVGRTHSCGMILSVRISKV